MPTQNYLCGGFIVFFADFRQNGIGKHILPAFPKRCPGFKADIILFSPFFKFFLLIKRVRFHLIDHRLNTAERSHINHTVNIEVRNAYRADFAFVIQIFQSAVRAEIIAKRLM